MQGYLVTGDTVIPLALEKGPRLPDGRLVRLEEGVLHLGSLRHAVLHAIDGDTLWVHLDGRIHALAWHDPVDFHEAAASSSGDNIVAAPMPGLVVRLIAADGTAVEKDDALLVIESMKLETTLRAPAAGTLDLHVATGQGFERGAPLATIAPKD